MSPKKRVSVEEHGHHQSDKRTVSTTEKSTGDQMPVKGAREGVTNAEISDSFHDCLTVSCDLHRPLTTENPCIGPSPNGTNNMNSVEEEDEEDEDTYRLRVYGTTDKSLRGGWAPSSPDNNNKSQRCREAPPPTTLARRSTSDSLRRLSSSVSRELSRRRSSLMEALPDTPAGWTLLTTTLSSVLLGYELRLQQSLTSPPLVFTQCNKNDKYHDSAMNALYQRLTQPPNKAILSRTIKPSLLVGTRSVLSSAAAYAALGPQKDHNRFREVMTMPFDGAKIAIDWELPSEAYESSISVRKSLQDRTNEILRGPITKPVVLILHGINNDAGFGYIRSLMRTCTDRGWIAAGMNFRGCGGMKLHTPRGYNAAYTGDIRGVVRQIESRLAKDVPLFLVGNSLGANLVVKYLGEEGFSGTLPKCVAGAVSLGNPLRIHSKNLMFPWGELLGAGIKKSILLNWNEFRKMRCLHFRSAILKALMARTIGQIDHILSPFLIRNEPVYPFQTRIGYKDGEDYWHDSSSYRWVQHVSVPLLKLTAQDDFLVAIPSLQKLSHCLENPNVMVVKTKCGGHLGWHESPPDTGNIFGFGTSWADTATADFIDAVIQVREEKQRREFEGADHQNEQVTEETPGHLSALNESATNIESGDHAAEDSNGAEEGKIPHAALLDEAMKKASDIRSRL